MASGFWEFFTRNRFQASKGMPPGAVFRECFVWNALKMQKTSNRLRSAAILAERFTWNRLESKKRKKCRSASASSSSGGHFGKARQGNRACRKGGTAREQNCNNTPSRKVRSHFGDCFTWNGALAKNRALSGLETEKPKPERYKKGDLTAAKSESSAKMAFFSMLHCNGAAKSLFSVVVNRKAGSRTSFQLTTKNEK